MDASWIPGTVVAIGALAVAIYKMRPERRRSDAGASRDVVEAAATLEAIQRRVLSGSSEPQLAAMLDASPDALLLVNRFGAIEFINRSGSIMFGYPPGQLNGKLVDDLVPERFRGKHPEHRARFESKPTTRPMGLNLELWGRRFDGTEFPVEIQLAPFQLVGMPEAKTIAVVRDMTQRQAT